MDPHRAIRQSFTIGLLGLLVLSLPAGPALAEPTDPPGHLGLTAVLEDVLQVPASAGSPPLARINVLREAPDGSGRLFVNDLRGPFHVIEGTTVETYLDLSQDFPKLKTAPGLASGFVSFAFHPDFATNGLFYTVHSEFVGATPPNLGPLNPPLPASIIQHSVLTEWDADDPTDNVFTGTTRELMRIASPTRFHNLQEIAFNPLAQSSDPDHGLLYIGSGDFGAIATGEPEQLQRLDTPYGAVLRIDPLGGPFVRDGTIYDYGIPPANPFASDGDPDTLDEIYAYGFRNSHRLAWDPATGALFASDIGQGNVEEINLLLPGRNHGWPVREGTFALDPLDPEVVFSLPPDDATFGITYPVVQYDHDEGNAIAGGQVYRGDGKSELEGSFIFGDIVTGRMYYADALEMLNADDGDASTVAPFFDLTLLHGGQEKTLLQIVRDAAGNQGIGRTDLRFGADRAGQIYVITKQDAYIRKLVALPRCSDGADNDGDGRIDFDPVTYANPGNSSIPPAGSGDPGCQSAASRIENPLCQDGWNNDYDTGMDYDAGYSANGSVDPGGPDPQCVGKPWKNREANASSCGMGIELALLLPPLMWFWRRRSLH